MIDYKKYYEMLSNNKMITLIWKYVLNMINESFNDDKLLKLLCLYFSLVDDGNITMSLDKKILLSKIDKKFLSNKVFLVDNDDFNEEEYDNLYKETLSLVDELDLLNDYCLDDEFSSLFTIYDNYFYSNKYNNARLSIINSVKTLFSSNNPDKEYDYKNIIKEGFSLSDGQIKAIKRGIDNNIIITGGPGTGKTTSILFLLLEVLSKNINYNVYLTAPSGKAASRMKESIINSSFLLKDEYKNKNIVLMDKINSLQESTIHRLLGFREGEDFFYNKNNKFDDNSIFIIDEASMIDICLFASLLDAIPFNAKVFIMGDKNQLPSVESGAVFADLLKISNVIELDESKRFDKNSKIYSLAREINEGKELSISDDMWKSYLDFKIEDDDNSKPIFYYKNKGLLPYEEKELCQSIINIWGERFYKDLQSISSNLNVSNECLDNVFNRIDNAKILTAENEGVRGVKSFNCYIKSKFINKSLITSVVGHYAGEIMMINKNNKLLDLYNGDTGILVTFENDSTLYFMVKKCSSLSICDGKKEDQIFKLGKYMFYPLRMITSQEIELAYAITIHKSQGSDYKNILVFLPTKIGHPLLNRQIIYTAITRTKGNTYIVSSKDILDYAKDTILVRDTNINL